MPGTWIYEKRHVCEKPIVPLHLQPRSVWQCECGRMFELTDQRHLSRWRPSWDGLSEDPEEWQR